MSVAALNLVYALKVGGVSASLAMRALPAPIHL